MILADRPEFAWGYMKRALQSIKGRGSFVLGLPLDLRGIVNVLRCVRKQGSFNHLTHSFEKLGDSGDN